jgi:hypothetical protein
VRQDYRLPEDGIKMMAASKTTGGVFSCREGCKGERMRQAREPGSFASEHHNSEVHILVQVSRGLQPQKKKVVRRTGYGCMDDGRCTSV